MGIKVWNPELQAFQEAKTPEAYDTASQAYVPSHGAIYDFGEQAWKDAWSPKLYLYNQGDECVNVTGGWELAYYSPHGIASNNSSSEYLSYVYVTKGGQYSYAYCKFFTKKSFDISQYKKLCAIVRNDGSNLKCQVGFTREFINVENVDTSNIVYSADTGEFVNYTGESYHKVELDLSGKDYMGNIFFGSNSEPDVSGTGYCKELWLEK